MSSSEPSATVFFRLALIGFVALLAACDSEENASEPVTRPVRVVTVEKGDAGQTVQLAGTVESQIQVDLAFRIGGRMTERLINVGDTVKAGQIIAKMDPTDEENGLRAAEASLAAAEGKLSEARLDYDRQRHLYERNVVARVAFERAEQVLSTAQASADSAEAQVGIARRRLEDTVLLADAPGVVTAIGAEPGEVVQAGRMIAQLARDDGKDAVFNVSAAIIAASPGDPAVEVELSQNPSVKAQGRVREVAPRADPVTGTFLVRVGLTDPPTEMRLGSTVVGRAVFGGGSGIELPASALTQTEGSPAVWVVDPKKSTVALRRIGVERFTPASILVSDGLKPGEIVVTAGVQALRPGQEVRLLGGTP
jgi:RND family efflux transporter MFP subunit